MRNLHDYLNLSLAASRGELGEHVKAASDGVYEGMRGEYAAINVPKKDKHGLLSKRSAELAVLGGLGSAFRGAQGAPLRRAHGLVGAGAAGLHSESGLGTGTAISTAVGSALGGAGHGVAGRAAGGALGASLGHEFFRRRAENLRRKPHGSS